MEKPQIEVPPEVIADFCRRWSIEELSLFGPFRRHEILRTHRVVFTA